MQGLNVKAGHRNREIRLLFSVFFVSPIQPADIKILLQDGRETEVSTQGKKKKMPAYSSFPQQKQWAWRGEGNLPLKAKCGTANAHK